MQNRPFTLPENTSNLDIKHEFREFWDLKLYEIHTVDVI